jgi:3-mercaptopyruvate sulfurtransferase SseA
VIVEPISASRRTSTRPEQTREHEISPEFVLEDVRGAGLRIIGLEDPFTTRGRVVEWMMTVTPGPTTTVIAANPPSAGLETGSRDWRDPGLRISVDEFVKITSSGSATIIDVRDEGMFAKGHIPNAILIPLDDVESSADRLRGLKQPFLTYCS